VKVAISEITVLAGGDDALALNANATWPTCNGAPHVLVGCGIACFISGGTNLREDAMLKL
jgi:hypothetical protein